MMCQNCKVRPATVNHTQTINGVSCAVHLCASCANEMFGSFEKEIENAVFCGLFGEPYAEKRVCPACGMSFSEYERSGLLGCPSCYDVFNEELAPHIAKIQGKTVHVGKGGGVYTAEHDVRRRLSALQNEMEDALTRGDYIGAGKINEQMNVLKKRLSGSRKWI